VTCASCRVESDSLYLFPDGPDLCIKCAVLHVLADDDEKLYRAVYQYAYEEGKAVGWKDGLVASDAVTFLLKTRYPEHAWVATQISECIRDFDGFPKSQPTNEAQP